MSARPAARDRPAWRRGLAPLALAFVMLMGLGEAALGRELTDATGRTVTLPDAPARVFAAGQPAAVLLYAVAPETMIGWPRAPREEDKPFLLPSVRDLPELGWLTGRGGTVNLETLLAAEPDLIVDFGTVSPAHVDLAHSITEQTGLPYILIDGGFENTPDAIRAMAEVLNAPERGEALATHAEAVLARVDAVLAAVPEEARPRIYLARGPEGLEAPARGSINAEIVERVGGINVVEAETRGLVTPSLEQVIAWAPDTIITIDETFAQSRAAEWREVPAVAEGRVFLAPSAPFGWIDRPPSVNRLIGLPWLLHVLYPAQAEGDLREEVRRFYRLFWQVELDDAALDGLIGG